MVLKRVFRDTSSYDRTKFLSDLVAEKNRRQYGQNVIAIRSYKPLYNFVWAPNQFFLFRCLLYLSRLSFFLFCFWLVYSPIVLFWLVYSISVWFLLYFVQYYTLKNDRIRENPKRGFPRIGLFFRVYSLSIRLSLQRTRHTNQTSAHIHLWTKFFPPSLFLWYHTLH